MKPCGVLCELTNPDGTMARMPEIVSFAVKHNMPVVTIEDLIKYREVDEKLA
jgi:3,4-dihydroxy 2-butanone 4-phosphate synthase